MDNRMNYRSLINNENQLVLKRLEEAFRQLDCHKPYLVTNDYKIRYEQRLRIYHDVNLNIISQIWQMQYKFNIALYNYLDRRMSSKWKWPISFEFIDYDGTADKFFQGYALNETPHIHSVYFFHPATLEKLEALELANPTQYFRGANNDLESLYSVHIVPIQQAIEDIRHVSDYNSKFALTQSRIIRNNLSEVDLWKINNHGISSLEDYAALRKKTIEWMELQKGSQLKNGERKMRYFKKYSKKGKSGTKEKKSANETSNAEFVSYPPSLRGLPSNKYGGQQLLRQEGFRGATYGAASKGKTLKKEDISEEENDRYVRMMEELNAGKRKK